MSIEEFEKRYERITGRVRWLFNRWRRCYGNHAISRFATGELDAEGRDVGVEEAIGEWADVIGRTFDRRGLFDALVDRVEAVHPKWPPTLPELTAQLVALVPTAMPVAVVEERIECNPAARKAEFEAIRAILKAAQVPKRRTWRTP